MSLYDDIPNNWPLFKKICEMAARKMAKEITDYEDKKIFLELACIKRDQELTKFVEGPILPEEGLRPDYDTDP